MAQKQTCYACKQEAGIVYIAVSNGIPMRRCTRCYERYCWFCNVANACLCLYLSHTTGS